MKTFFDDEIHKMNVNTLFIPTFVSLDFLQTLNDDIKFLYPKVVLKSNLIENSHISRSFILTPHAVKIWGIMKTFFDDEIQKMNVNTSFILTFASLDFLQTLNDDIKFFVSKYVY
ncbi:hypothetical protein KSP40_PGU019449 [Platanthera guangdongensis]|uniref:Uncharacterized protein n=1 Tax=Platanthera guangdongensis TaxID=2320717 RepID=A0ABR2M9T6_9ASPA